MQKHDPIDTIEQLLARYTIPPRPHILNQLASAFETGEPSVEALAVLISADPGLSAQILQMANAEFMALPTIQGTRIDRLDHAILLLGKFRIHKIVTELYQFHQLQEESRFAAFWDDAADVAIIASYLSQRLLSADPKQAYLLGLFHDAGIPILIQGVPGYQERFYPIGGTVRVTDPDAEIQYFGIDHQMVGYRLSLQFGCDPLISRAILTHHNLEDPKQISHDFGYYKNVLIAIVQIAEKISYRFRSVWRDDQVILRIGDVHPYILTYLEISKEDLEDLMEDTHDKVEELLALYQR